MSNNYPDPNAEHFDVFLCHNSEDKAEIRQIADELSRRGLRPWLDEREIPPGKSWQAILETQIETIKAAAVFVGKSGLGPWQNMEMRAFINEFVERACPVIPVILPSATETPKLPILLKSLHWVDFRKTGSDPFKQMIWGINGEKPDHQNPNNLSVSDPEVPCKVDEKDLLSAKAKQMIELRLPGNVEEFSPEQQMTLMQSLSALLKLGEVKVTRVVAGSIRLYLEADQADADKLYNASKEGRLEELSISEARLYPAIAMPPDQEQRAQLLILLNRVQEYWVDGVLKQSLHHEVLIGLGKHAMDEAVEPPWKHVVALPTDRRHLLLQDRNINTVFDATGLLLILGEPGSGKTTTLLELAASLTQRARNDHKERVPIVLNLSSWEKSQSLDKWIAAELSTKYRVPLKIAMTWLAQDYFLPLLDGLDEVQIAIQPECVAAINEFIERNNPSGLVVSCRLAEYQWLPERLKLNGAICLEPLSPQDVNKFLIAGGTQLAGLQQALNSDPILQELSRSPLMLSIMSMACEGADSEALISGKGDSPKARRDAIFKLYVERMFQRKRSITSQFSQEQTMGWLSWLARKMVEQSQSMFMVEELQPYWLSLNRQWLAYEAVTAMSIGLLFGLIIMLFLMLPTVDHMLLDTWLLGLATRVASVMAGMLTIGPLIALSILLGCRSNWPVQNGVMSGLAGGLVFAIASWMFWGPSIRLSISSLISSSLFIGMLVGLGIGSLKEIHLVQTELIQWSQAWKDIQWSQVWKKVIAGAIAGLAIGVIIIELDDIFYPDSSLRRGFEIRGYIVLWFGSLGGTVGALVGMLGNSHKVKVNKSVPGEGIKLSIKNGLSVVFASLLILGPYSVIRGVSWEAFVLSMGLLSIVGLGHGGAAVIKHYSLRLILWLTGSTPFRFIPFLDHCAKLILLKKVGGGYIFIHRILLEYFAGLSPEAKKAKETSPGSAS
jgi:hypothetical protein